MPKAKPTQVIVHRIELQEKEREMLETLVVTKAASNVALGINNVTMPIIAGFGAYTAYMTAKAAEGWFDDEVGPWFKRQWEWFVRGDDGKFFFWEKKDD